MRKSYIFELLIVSLAFAVSCDRNETPLEEPCDLIQIAASGEDVQTRGLLNMADLPTVDTKVKIYDYLTGFTGKIGTDEYTNGNVMYINDEVKCVTAGTTAAPKGSWEFVTAPWRWTRTGTHHFFGWLTYDKKSNLNVTDLLTPPDAAAPVTPNFADNTLGVPAITFTKDTPQFDFSYSDIVTKTAPENVEIPLKHLFTALAVTVENGAGKQITINSITLNNIVNGCTASVNYTVGAEDAGVAKPADGSPQDFIVSGSSFTITGGATSTFSNGYTGEQLTGTSTPVNDDFRLLWPQDDMTSANVIVDYKIGNADAVTKTISLKNVFKEGETVTNKMKAGYKDAIKLSIAPKGLYVNVTVLPWTAMAEYEYEYNISTGLSAATDYWRYDLDGDYTSWAESYMAVSTGYVKDVHETETQEDLPTGQTPTEEYFPKRSARIRLTTTVRGIDDGLVLRLDNPKFKFVTYNPPVSEYDPMTGQTTVTPASFDHSYDGEIPIPIGTNDLYFYVVPKERFSTSASDAEKTCKVFLTTSATSVASIKIPFNSESLPGNSDLSDEIWFYYLDDSVYGTSSGGQIVLHQ